MSEEAKTYVFGNSNSQFAPLMAAMNIQLDLFSQYDIK